MSLESTLERVAISAERSELLLAKLLTAIEDLAEAVGNTTNEPAPRPQVPAPVPAAPVEAPPAPPPAPVPTVPVTPAAGGAPFTDQAGLMTYVMEKYKALGPTKGAMIQSKLLELGCANIKALPVDKYAAFHAAVEAL
jgi:hypothetical protein